MRVWRRLAELEVQERRRPDGAQPRREDARDLETQAPPPTVAKAARASCSSAARTRLLFGLPATERRTSRPRFPNALIRCARRVFFTPTYLLSSGCSRRSATCVSRSMSRCSTASSAVILDDVGSVQRRAVKTEVLFTFGESRQDRGALREARPRGSQRGTRGTPGIITSPGPRRWDLIFEEPTTTEAMQFADPPRRDPRQAREQRARDMARSRRNREGGGR